MFSVLRPAEKGDKPMRPFAEDALICCIFDVCRSLSEKAMDQVKIYSISQDHVSQPCSRQNTNQGRCVGMEGPGRRIQVRKPDTGRSVGPRRPDDGRQELLHTYAAQVLSACACFSVLKLFCREAKAKGGVKFLDFTTLWECQLGGGWGTDSK
jgi:hypothetical protein